MINQTKLQFKKSVNRRERIQKHGEVFTPPKTVNKMLDLPNVKQACQSLTATFLEPSAGQGAFLVEILKRKLQMITEKYGNTLEKFENYSLLALSTLYGVELLEDNSHKCAVNIYNVYFKRYYEQALMFDEKVKNNVLRSARFIISQNIVQGNFLTKLTDKNLPIIFSEWNPLRLGSDVHIIVVQRIEYTLDEILNQTEQSKQEQATQLKVNKQLDIYDFLEESEEDQQDYVQRNYQPVNITNVYKEEKEEANGSHGNSSL